jgi:hypothetical protein
MANDYHWWFTFFYKLIMIEANWENLIRKRLLISEFDVLSEWTLLEVAPNQYAGKFKDEINKRIFWQKASIINGGWRNFFGRKLRYPFTVHTLP